MTQPKHRIIVELNKLYEQALSKGRDQRLALQNVTETMIKNKDGLPKVPTTKEIVDKMKNKVNHSMTVYEDFIGIRQVKEAHERVLNAELNFKKCQEHRRSAQIELAEVQNTLRLLRVDIDRTPRGDNRYLELIKNEIDIIRKERDLRSTFEDLERSEREVFSELSNALRFSHEKERAQSEKTKYWSILGSLIGACIGIIGTTFNSRLRHQQTQAILDQTSSQVKEIEATVMKLAEKLDVDQLNSKFLVLTKLTEITEKFFKAFEEQEQRLNKTTTAILAANAAVERKLGRLLVEFAYYENPGLDPGVRKPQKSDGPRPLSEFLDEDKTMFRSREKEVFWVAVGIMVISTIVYKIF